MNIDEVGNVDDDSIALENKHAVEVSTVEEQMHDDCIHAGAVCVTYDAVTIIVSAVQTGVG